MVQWCYNLSVPYFPPSDRAANFSSRSKDMASRVNHCCWTTRRAPLSLGVCVGLILLGLQVDHGLAQIVETPSPEADRKVILTHYMPWYIKDGGWGMHWTGPQQQHDPGQLDHRGLPDIWSHFHPLIGVYDSADPHLIECHLLQMKLAGIDGIVLDWYGLSDIADYARLHHACQNIVEGVRKFELNFAICFEDRSIKNLVHRGALAPSAVKGHLTDTLRWLDQQWLSDPLYVHSQGSPLLLNFGPIYVQDSAVWHAALEALEVRPRFYALHHLWKTVEADGGFAWVHPKVWSGAPTGDQVAQRLEQLYLSVAEVADQVIPAALPGYRDVYRRGHPDVEYRDGATLREALQVALNGPWPIVQVVTWNDYGEGTMIEPTHEFGYSFLEIVQQARRKELGGDFRYSSRDLRLPARLYFLRQAGEVESHFLDEISQMLVQGETNEASSALDRLARLSAKKNEPRISRNLAYKPPQAGF